MSSGQIQIDDENDEIDLGAVEKPTEKDDGAVEDLFSNDEQMDPYDMIDINSSDSDCNAKLNKYFESI